MIGKQYIKKGTITVVGQTNEGYIVHNTDYKEDKWVIPYNVFKQTYIPVKDVKNEKG